MIKFFRKIRQKLINETKFSLYLLYIIGEIILVVVGILVALSINNWNESKKMSLIERNILREISNGLTTDLINIESNISGHEKGINSCVYWVKIINNKPVNIDSIQYYYHYLTRNFISVQNIAGYESLKSRGDPS